jgi:hypothetical protein
MRATYIQHLWMHLYRQLWRGAIVNFDCPDWLRYEREACTFGNGPPDMGQMWYASHMIRAT